MIKKELVERIADETGFMAVDIHQVLQLALDNIVACLARGERIELRDFGVFEIVQRRPRLGRNPARPQQTYQIPARRGVRFKPGRIMREKVAANG